MKTLSIAALLFFTVSAFAQQKPVAHHKAAHHTMSKKADIKEDKMEGKDEKMENKDHKMGKKMDKKWDKKMDKKMDKMEKTDKK